MIATCLDSEMPTGCDSRGWTWCQEEPSKQNVWVERLKQSGGRTEIRCQVVSVELEGHKMVSVGSRLCERAVWNTSADHMPLYQRRDCRMVVIVEVWNAAGVQLTSKGWRYYVR